MKLNRKVGVTSEIWQVFIRDSSSTTGAGLTGLAFNSASLVAYYHRDTDTTATAISLATMTIGTFTSGGFKEIDATNMPGWYQFCPPNAALASGAKSCGFHLKGATNMAPLPIEVDLDAQVDVTHWNGTAVTSPNTAGTPIVDVTRWLGTTVSTPTVAGVPNVNVKTWNDLTTVALPLVPTVAGRSLDVSAGGESGVDWANVGSPTTTVDLSGTTIAITQRVDVNTFKTQSITCAAGITVGAFVGNATAAVGVDASGRVDIGKALGTAVTLDANNVLNVSAKYLGGTLQTARDIGASVLLSSGSGSGQLDFTSGVVKSNVTQSNGTTNQATAGYFAPDWGHVNAPTTTVDLSATTIAITQRVDANTIKTQAITCAAGVTVAPFVGNSTAAIGVSAAGKVNGVVLVDTVTVNTDMITQANVRSAVGLASANLDTQIAALQADTDNIQTRIPAALTADGNIKADVQGINSDTAGVAGLNRSAKCIGIGTIGAASTVRILVTSSLTPSAAVANQFIGRVLTFAKDTTTAVLRGQASPIESMTAGGIITLETALTTAPISGDVFSVN